MTEKDPTKIGKILDSYLHNLDAIRESLDPVMIMAEAVHKSASEQHLKALEKYGKLDSEDDGQKTFLVPLENGRFVERKRRRHYRARSAMDLLPRTFLVSFISEYDSFLSLLIGEIFRRKPEVLNASERTLTFKELSSYASIDDARIDMAREEIESIMRDSHAEQFRWLSSRFDISLNKDLERWSVFIEVCERRNLYVHCNGVVSAQYLSVCQAHKVDLSNVSLGDTLNPSREYLVEAYKCLYEFGVKLSQVLWRKLLPGEMEKADGTLNYFAYELLIDEKFELATRLLEFGVNVLKKHSSDNAKRMLVINLAQAYKYSNREGDRKLLLGKYDWSACGDDFAICLAVLENDFNGASDIMKRIGDNGVVDESNYQEWPIFREFRESQVFKETFVGIFGHEPIGVKQHGTDGNGRKSSDDRSDSKSDHGG